MLVLTLVACSSFEAGRLYLRGSEALERGDALQAIADLERAAQLLPHASEVHNHLGLAYLKAGRTAAAEAAFGHALEIDCENEAAAQNLAALRAGALALQPSSPEVLP